MITNSVIENNPEQALIHEFFVINPFEAAQKLNNYPINEIQAILQSEPVEQAIKVFENLNPAVIVKILAQIDDNFFVELFNLIHITTGARFLSQLDSKFLDHKLDLLPAKLVKEYREYMSYPQDTAGHIMDPRVTVFSENVTVGEVLKEIRSIKNRRIIDVCITGPAGCLKAVIPLQSLAISHSTVKLKELISGEPVCIHAMAPKDEIVSLFESHKLVSVPVVDLDKRLLGIIRYDALVDAARQDISEDIQVMFGVSPDERALSRVSFALRKRLVWLEVNLATAFLAAAVVGLFEDTIARITALAVFLPVVAGQSGNTGSQALAVTMRGLALREIRASDWLKIMKKEVMVGFLNGIVIALSTSLIVYIWMNSLGLSFVIAIAMVFSMIIAGLAGAVIPMMLKAFGQDPAQSSSIILTTVTDVVGFMSFLGLAKLLAEIIQFA